MSVCPRPAVGTTLLVLLLAASAGPAQEAPADKSARPYLGVAIGPAAEGERGVLVKDVAADSPAARAGLKNGDRVVKVGDQDMADAEQFLRAVASRKPGDRLSLRVARGGQEQTVTATLGERPAAPGLPPAGLPGPSGLPAGRRPAFLGVQAQPLTPALKQRLGIYAETGVIVTEVVSSSAAARAGLKPEDVITAVNDRPVRDPAQLREAVQQAGPGKEVALHVVRGKENLTLRAKLQEGTIGHFLLPGNEPFPTVDVESLFGRGRALERRIEELEKRVRELEQKLGTRSP
jgi:S1-C subfamily serine protease